MLGQGIDDGAVLVRAGGDGHVAIVLGRRAQHRRPADVDVFDRLLQRAAGAGHGGLERIEVHDQQVDRRDLLLGHHVGVDIAPPEQPAVDARVQGLHPAIHDFGEACVLRDFGHRQAFLGQQAGGAAGGQEFDAPFVQGARELRYAGLFGYG